MVVVAALASCRSKKTDDEMFPSTSYVVRPVADAGDPLICLNPDGGWYYCEHPDAG